MRRGFHRRARRFVASAAVLALLALSALFVVPHSWHKEDGKRACAFCQVHRMPSSPAQPVIQPEPPTVACGAEGRSAQVSETSRERVVYSSRAPPFRVSA